MALKQTRAEQAKTETPSPATPAASSSAVSNATAGDAAAKPAEPMVACRSPRREGEPTFIEKWRYDLVRQAILNVVPADDIGLMFKQLTMCVRSNLSKENRQKLGSIHFYTTLVKLDMEVRGELVRIQGMRPQYLRRAQ